MKARKSGWIPKWQAEMCLNTGIVFFFTFQAENWDNIFGNLLNWRLFPSLSQDANAGSNFHCWSQCEFFSIPLAIRNSDTRKKKCHQNSAGSNLPSLDFNLTTIRRKNPNMIFAADRKERECWELLRCLIALKPFPQKLKWWNSAWNVLDAFTHREMRWVNLLQLGDPQTFMFVHLNTKTRFFFVVHVWIHPECFWFSHPVQGKENQRGSSSFPQPSLSCPVMLMLHEVFPQAIAAQNLFGALGLLFSGYIKSFL